MPRKRRRESAPRATAPAAPTGPTAPPPNRPEGKPADDGLSVRLKPILGFKPGQYLTVLYSVALCLLVFFLLFYPGLHRRGQYLVVSSVPARATVKVDGVFAGTAPCTIFVRRGDRRIEISRPFFQPVSAPLKVRGRIFATLIVPDKARKSFELGAADAEKLASWALADFQANPTVPTAISEAAWAAYKAPGNRAILYDFVNNCRYFVQAESQLREVVLAGGRIAAAGQVLTPLALVSYVQKMAQAETEHENMPAWFLLSLSRDSGRKLGATPWATAYLAAYRQAMSAYYQGSSPAAAGGGARGPVLQGVSFRSIPAGTLVMGNDEKPDNFGRTIEQALAHPVAVAGFFLAETEITNRQFSAFLAENPGWLPSSRDALASRGLVSDQYLAGWAGDRPTAGSEDLPVTGVSWHAATAYCQWLTARAGSSLSGQVVRLPTEAEWEWAARGGLRGMPYPLGDKPGASVLYTKDAAGPARAGTSEPNAWGMRDMLGNAWEWCADSYAPAAYLLSTLDPKQNAELASRLPASNDKVVRGGSWNNARDQVKVYTRGSQPADWCTPYLGFRVAIARR